MICASCGGEVTWRGAFSNLTYTQCSDCGRINNQQVEFIEEEYSVDLDEEDVELNFGIIYSERHGTESKLNE